MDLLEYNFVMLFFRKFTKPIISYHMSIYVVRVLSAHISPKLRNS